MRVAWSIGASALLALVVGGCAKPKPATQPDLPPLEAPAPPPRVLPPIEARPIEAVVPIPADPPGRPRQASRPRERNGDGLRPDLRPVEQPPAPAVEALPQVDPSPAAQEPAQGLQLAPRAAASESAIRQQLLRAATDLSRVDYKALNSDARTQYDTAKRFMILADQAIKEGNFIFAQTLADKAGTIAAVLSR